MVMMESQGLQRQMEIPEFQEKMENQAHLAKKENVVNT
jgi:hypothetical protein